MLLKIFNSLKVRISLPYLQQWSYWSASCVKPLDRRSFAHKKGDDEDYKTDDCNHEDNRDAKLELWGELCEVMHSQLQDYADAKLEEKLVKETQGEVLEAGWVSLADAPARRGTILSWEDEV